MTRTWRVTDQRGHVHAIKITVSSWKLMALIDASTKIPLAEPKVLVNEYEVLSMRTIVRQARTNLGGHARLHKVVCDQGFWDGVELWCLEPGEITFVVPAKDHMAMTTDVRA